MELDATTFALEILNFLVLLWLLNRFLFRPLRANLAARAATEAQQAERLRTEHEQLDARAAALAQQAAQQEARRGQAERALAEEIAALRQRQLDQLQRELTAEREKARAAAQQELARARQQDERALRERAAAFVAGYLRRLATPAVEAAVVELFLDDLAQQAGPARAALRDGWDPGRDAAPTVDVCTAHDPAPAQRERIDTEVRALAGAAVQTRWRRDPALLAGICVHLPGHQLEASLRRGVDAFAAED
ncbi:MAG: hypothetical protein KF788_09510 [Piscinibacter sp.]|nr:hypothetical protein [Piscinibacter sp.]